MVDVAETVRKDNRDTGLTYTRCYCIDLELTAGASGCAQGRNRMEGGSGFQIKKRWKYSGKDKHPLPNSLQMEERVVNLAPSRNFISVTLLTASARTLSAIRTTRGVISSITISIHCNGSVHTKDSPALIYGLELI